jgi:hypothetical protein
MSPEPKASLTKHLNVGCSFSQKFLSGIHGATLIKSLAFTASSKLVLSEVAFHSYEQTIPFLNGSLWSRRSIASAQTKASPLITGTMRPSVCASAKLASK